MPLLGSKYIQTQLGILATLVRCMSVSVCVSVIMWLWKGPLWWWWWWWGGGHWLSEFFALLAHLEQHRWTGHCVLECVCAHRLAAPRKGEHVGRERWMGPLSELVCALPGLCWPAAPHPGPASGQTAGPGPDWRASRFSGGKPSQGCSPPANVQTGDNPANSYKHILVT